MNILKAVREKVIFASSKMWHSSFLSHETQFNILSKFHSFFSIQLYWHLEVDSCILVLFSSLVKSNKPRTEQSMKIPSPPQILSFVPKKKKEKSLTRQR